MLNTSLGNQKKWVVLTILHSMVAMVVMSNQHNNLTKII